MLVLITYDVSTEDARGKARLRKVAKQCVNYGQRVQNSVFECILDASQLLLFKDRLIKIINEELLKSAKLTGIWENKLRRIERGQYSPGEFISELKAMISQIVINVLSDNSGTKINTSE